MMKRFNFENQKGLSVIELLLVLSITVILAGVFVSPFRSFQDTQAVQNAQDSILSVIIDARTKTLSSLSSKSYGIHFSESPTTSSQQLVEFSGTTYDPNDASNVTVALSNNARITNVSLNGGGVDMIFNRLTGGTNQYGTITLEVSPAATIYTRTLTVNKAGAVSPSN